MVFRAWAHEWHHKTRDGWYLGLVVPISSIVGLLILYMVQPRGNVALARNIFLVTRTSTTQTRYLPSPVYKLLTQKWLYP